MYKKKYKKGSRLIRMVNAFAERRDEVGLIRALEDVAETFNRDMKDVAEAMFPYLAEYERSTLLAMKNMFVGANFIYKCRVRRGMPASKMRRYRYRTFLVA